MLRHLATIISLVISFNILSFIALAADYKIDKAHSQIGFKVKHLGISNVKGDFTKFEGTGTFDEKNGKISNVKIAIVTDSISTNEPDRDKHLKSPDFLDAAKFNDIKFESSGTANAKSGADLKGKLTMKGVTKDVTLKITEWGGAATDPYGNEKLAFQATGKIDRTQFGVTWQKPLAKAGGLTVGNDIDLTIDVEATKIKDDKK